MGKQSKEQAENVRKNPDQLETCVPPNQRTLNIFFNIGWDREKLFSIQNPYNPLFKNNRFSIYIKYYVTIYIACHS